MSYEYLVIDRSKAGAYILFAGYANHALAKAFIENFLKPLNIIFIEPPGTDFQLAFIMSGHDDAGSA